MKSKLKILMRMLGYFLLILAGNVLAHPMSTAAETVFLFAVCLLIGHTLISCTFSEANAQDHRPLAAKENL